MNADVRPVDLRRGVHGFVDLSRAPYKVGISVNQPPYRAMIALVHELFHIVSRTYKVPMTHTHLHIMAVQTVTEVFPQMIKALTGRRLSMDEVREALGRALTATDADEGLMETIEAATAALRARGLADASIEVYDEDDELISGYEDAGTDDDDDDDDDDLDLDDDEVESLDLAMDLMDDEDLFDDLDKDEEGHEVYDLFD